jgi:hypothetical protein
MCQLCSYFFHYFSSEKTGILRDTHIPAYPYVSPSWCSILHCNPRWPCWAPEVFEVQLSDWVHNLHIHRRPGQSLLPDRSSQTKKKFRWLASAHRLVGWNRNRCAKVMAAADLGRGTAESRDRGHTAGAWAGGPRPIFCFEQKKGPDSTPVELTFINHVWKVQITWMPKTKLT